MNTNLAGNVRDFETARATSDPTSNGNESDSDHTTGNGTNDATNTGLPIDAFGPPVSTEVPMPTNGNLLIYQVLLPGLHDRPSAAVSTTPWASRSEAQEAQAAFLVSN